MNMPRTSQTIAQQSALAASRNMIYTAERERILREWSRPEPRRPSPWQQVRAEFRAAPLLLRVIVLGYFVAGIAGALWLVFGGAA